MFVINPLVPVDGEEEESESLLERYVREGLADDGRLLSQATAASLSSAPSPLLLPPATQTGSPSVSRSVQCSVSCRFPSVDLALIRPSSSLKRILFCSVSVEMAQHRAASSSTALVGGNRSPNESALSQVAE